jgi:hypothetical protein
VADRGGRTSGPRDVLATLDALTQEGIAHALTDEGASEFNRLAGRDLFDDPKRKWTRQRDRGLLRL